MNSKSREITQYFRSAVAAQINSGIDFKTNEFYIFSKQELKEGIIDFKVCKQIFEDENKSTYDDRSSFKERSTINIIISAKTIKTIYDSNEKTQDEIQELTGVFFIPAILKKDGSLLFNEGEKKLPWFPREYLLPMVESKLAIGEVAKADGFMSNHVDRVEKINSWSSYYEISKEYYEFVSESSFDQNEIRNMDSSESSFELENNVYMFVDNTINSTFHIMNLYNHILKDDSNKPLYNDFVSTEIKKTIPLIENNFKTMQIHSGQMGGNYPLSTSQREAVNHFNYMADGEILAVNGPPGTGKTTLLQSIVADMYVKRALGKEKPPLIVATSTNNQAVTNIIASFGNIEKVGILNLEERWIEGVNSFASYFPSASKVKEAKTKGYQYTTQKGEYFVDDVDNADNIEKSKEKLINHCNEYFKTEYGDVNPCQKRLHEELVLFDECKINIIKCIEELQKYDLKGEPLDKYIETLTKKINEWQGIVDTNRRRIDEWSACYGRIPFLYKLFSFLKTFSRKIQIEFRLFINEEEQSFLNEYMSLDQIKEKYGFMNLECMKVITALKTEKEALEKIKNLYDSQISNLKSHHIDFYEDESSKYDLNMDSMNNMIDTKIRYMEFWLAVHYYECRWVSGESSLTEKQKGKNFKNVLDDFYNRLSMITPCLVMTFYMLPRQFLAYGDQKSFYLYSYIDLLIVDEAGQVSPEIAAGSFSLAKRAIVVGDVYQIEPVWSINRALDKALALASKVISMDSEFSQLETNGLNCSSSSVMVVAAKSCKYEKYGEKGLFLSEHRRCYNEIIDYCNKLVYNGNLQPMRGEGIKDKKLAIRLFPQMGYRQIDSDYSTRKGSSRINYTEAKEIVAWLKANFENVVKAYTNEEQANLVGIITPFKAQVKCIEDEVRRSLPQYYSKISVGTVHTFQGAERKIIILSTVYGKYDGCYFIDSNKSLMNVAVSRAKDNFFVFGDINCLKDNKSSASGLLKGAILDNFIN